MMTKQQKLVCLGPAILAIGAGSTRAQEPLTAAFTYQGQLRQAGIPVSDTADFRFVLFDAETGGNQVSSILTASNVDVIDGLFTVELDFGADVFNGDARWMLIGVRSPAGGGSYTWLSPPQPLTAVPYATQTRGIYVDEAENVGVGTTSPAAKLHVDNGDLRVDGKVQVYQDGALAVESNPATPGGTLEFRSTSTGGCVAEVGTSGTDGASLVLLRDRTGLATTVEIDGDSDDANNGVAAGLVRVSSTAGGPGGELVIENGDGATTFQALGGDAGDGGTLEMFDRVGNRTVLLDGDDGTGADLHMFNTAGVRTIDLDSENDIAGAGWIGITDGVSTSHKVRLDGGGGSDGGGEVSVRAADGSSTLLVDGQADNDGGSVSVRNDTSEETIALIGDDGTDAGAIHISNREGSLDVNTLTLDAQEDNHETGAWIVGRAEDGSETFILDTSDTAAGGAAMVLKEQDGSLGLYYSTLNKYLWLYNSDGVPTIAFDGQTGSKSGVVTTVDYGQRLLYAVESPEVWFEDFGSGRLINGEARVDLDPIFLQTVTINEQNPLKVFVTLTDECNGVFVKKGCDHFTVHELAGGRSNATFDWRVVAKREGLENVRLEQLEQKTAGVTSELLTGTEYAPARIPNDGIDDPDAKLEEE